MIIICQFLILVTMQVAILGRQPKLSLAELESLFRAENVQPILDDVALVKSNDVLPQARLGGTMKSATILEILPNCNLEKAFVSLQSLVVSLQSEMPDGKLQLGVSVYGFKAQKNWLLRQMLELKKAVKKAGRSVRIIENKQEALETAQILYNKLTSELGLEILIIKHGQDVIIAKTTDVQDIDAYRRRDFERPKRDAYNGMLPPKLAQILINLAKPEENNVILDPFCGTGVVLQEALLMGYGAYGTDLNEKMVDYTEKNLEWLTDSVIPDTDRESRNKNHLDPRITSEDDNNAWFIEQADATNHTWRPPINRVICETYLGTPLTHLPDEQKLNAIVHEVDELHTKFLKNIGSQLQKGARLCLAVPAWHLGNEKFRHLKTLDSLEDLGYNRLVFKSASKSELIYHRPDQTTARELVILEKI